MSTYRIARMEDRHVAAQYDFEGATLGEAFEQARVWWHLSHTDDLRCLGVVLQPLPQRETIAPKRSAAADLVVTGWGESVVLLRAQTPAGEDWIDEHLPPRESVDVTIWGDAFVVEPRYLQPIIDGAVADGLGVRVHA